MRDPKTTYIAIANFVILIILIVAFIFEKITYEQMQDVLTLVTGGSVAALGYFSKDHDKKVE